jgi:hypothetical protein
MVFCTKQTIIRNVMFYKLLRILETTSLHTGTEKLKERKNLLQISLSIAA